MGSDIVLLSQMSRPISEGHRRRINIISANANFQNCGFYCYAVTMTSNSVEFKKVCFVVIAFNPTTQSFNHAQGRYQVALKLPDKILITNLVRNCYLDLIQALRSEYTCLLFSRNNKKKEK